MSTIYDDHADLVLTTVTTSPGTSGLTANVQAGTGAWFGTPPFQATIWPADQAPTLTNAEIVRVSDVTVDTLTFARAQEGTTAQPIAAGYQISASITAKVLNDIEAAVSAVETLPLLLSQTVDASAVTGGSHAFDLGFYSQSAYPNAVGETTFLGISLSTNLTATVINANEGDVFVLFIKANSHTFTPPTGTKWEGNVAPTFTNSAWDVVAFYVQTQSGGVPTRLLGRYSLGFPT